MREGQSIEKPWGGIISEEDYNIITSKMPQERKKGFDKSLIDGDVDFLMGLGGHGLFEPLNKCKKENGIDVEKNYRGYLETILGRPFPDLSGKPSEYI